MKRMINIARMNEIIIDSFSTQTTQIRRIFTDKKKSVVICINLRHLCAYCLNQDSQDYRIYRMRKIEKKSPKDFNMYNPLQAKHSWGIRITPTLSELRSSSICYHGNHSNHINHSSDKRDEGTKGLSSCHCCRDAKHRVFFKDKRKETTPVRHCGLDPQSPFIRRIRREASRLYNLGDSDLHQNDGYRYTKEMSRRGLNMYNPLQAKRSWGYKITTTLSELRSSSIYNRNNHSNHINHSSDRFSAQMTQILQIFADKKKICGHLFESASSACLLPYNK
jgi:hypothetical protein